MLAISQFTLFADTRKGRRPSFLDAAPPELGNALYERFAAAVEERGVRVARVSSAPRWRSISSTMAR